MLDIESKMVEMQNEHKEQLRELREKLHQKEHQVWIFDVIGLVERDTD